MLILVIGGAGYIGSHMVKMLIDHNHKVVTLDNLSSGNRDAVLGGEFVEGNFCDETVLNRIFNKYRFDGVLHFASFIQVGESVTDPGKYYMNNLAGTIILLNSIVKHKVANFIYSSSAAVYGEPNYTPIDENHPCRPINPYGHSKWMVEQILSDFDKAYSLNYVSLRYFNAAGAHPECILGERHNPETHLIPLVLQVASGKRVEIILFGEDYETTDGTCIRDYVHIQDICQAHLKALEYLTQNKNSIVCNLGNGRGFSVREVIDTACKVTGNNIPVVNAARRDGDPAILVADCTFAKEELGWKPEFEKLETIIEHAWKWEQKI